MQCLYACAPLNRALPGHNLDCNCRGSVLSRRGQGAGLAEDSATICVHKHNLIRVICNSQVTSSRRTASSCQFGASSQQAAHQFLSSPPRQQLGRKPCTRRGGRP